MTVNNTGSLPWHDRMRRLDSEWLAPQDVLTQVRSHYLEVVEWMHNSLLTRSARLWSMSGSYLSGAYWQRCQDFLRDQVKYPRTLGVIRADHRLDVRYFSRTGAVCHVIDYQIGRRMASYEPTHMTRIGTQDLGDGADVYLMRYDARDRRWKIDAFVQELSMTWNQQYQPIRPLLKKFDQHFGRDS